ncbi:hypothetical protein A4X13_0g8412 [Tilletia indica]|uniref:Uncharacterized protein n=1 Tax=Tilletia indica TaxID=43049 RepID=A0A177TJH5_9BASI|nr:hypothetical protein A4X13_0g8412 [Tilletia indica]
MASKRKSSTAAPSPSPTPKRKPLAAASSSTPTRKASTSALPALPLPTPKATRTGTQNKRTSPAGDTSSTNKQRVPAVAGDLLLDTDAVAGPLLAPNDTGEGSAGNGSGIEREVASAVVLAPASVAGTADAGANASTSAAPLPMPTPVSKATAKSKAKAKPDTALQWKNDAFAPGYPSSFTITLNWLQENNNYDKWKGSEGDTQVALASDIVQRMVKYKCQSVRTPSAVVDKIKSMEKSFREANDWRKQTGQGILDDAAAVEDQDSNDEDGEDSDLRLTLAETSVEEAVRKRCSFYYEIVDIMGDRIASNPKGSYSTTGKGDPAGAALRKALVSSEGDDGQNKDEDSMSEDSEEHENEEDDGGDKEGGGNEYEGGGKEDQGEKEQSGDKEQKTGEANEKGKEKVNEAGKEKKITVKKEGKGRPSNTGRKFGKADTSSSSKRKPSAVEMALENRSKERTKMDGDLNKIKMKAEKLAAIMSLAREYCAKDHMLEFQEAMEKANVYFENM